MSFTPPRLLAVFAVVVVFALPLSLAFALDARAQSTEDIYQQAKKFYDENNYTEAAPLFRQVAEQGYADAQDALGLIYLQGKGVKQDDDKAVGWYRKAAEQGLAVAQKNLGVMYAKEQDDKQSAEWYSRAAEQGNVKAQYNLGYFYQEGKGVLKNHQKAAKWYRKAAEQGHADALFKLSFIYLKNQGVKRDTPTAYALFLLSAKEGNKNARYLANELKKMLTAEQVMAGQKIAREWEQRIEVNKQKNR